MNRRPRRLELGRARVVGLALAVPLVLSSPATPDAGLLMPVADGTLPAQQQPARPPDIFFAPTWEPIVHAMLKLAEVTPQDVVYDLGSGDGRIVIIAAQQYGARGVGIEIDPALVERSRHVARDAQVESRVRFIEGDLFTAEISPATVVTLYLSGSINRQLEPKLRRELAPGTRVVSHQFPIGQWTPERTVRTADGTDLFLWRVGE